ncbi:hypothetical protein BDK51DRAFT_40359 [Blyttiomyces helicus]|uniref:Uncharacterized protein n=1 Tax=Blyttiomyces helicus TaxID=388810 RepID=A0A4P9VXT4_9FUNG|nr:hypothetical protein BDK51DRAFT_40359 [Blyttiomyces helicus]|eukprot:RKO84052.1 hypothetical protein BDK51DRAFT_40359 [Blyttiomyces helicus]
MSRGGEDGERRRWVGAFEDLDLVISRLLPGPPQQGEPADAKGQGRWRGAWGDEAESPSLRPSILRLRSSRQPTTSSLRTSPRSAMAAVKSSFVPVPKDSDFSIHNIPFGVISTAENVRARRCRLVLPRGTGGEGGAALLAVGLGRQTVASRNCWTFSSHLGHSNSATISKPSLPRAPPPQSATMPSTSKPSPTPASSPDPPSAPSPKRSSPR